MKTHPLGSAGPPVSALALGCMGMSDWYGPADEAESIATIHAAIDAGINLLSISLHSRSKESGPVSAILNFPDLGIGNDFSSMFSPR
jgi:predicted aldo/keto reductase-like oxidoreductase